MPDKTALPPTVRAYLGLRDNVSFPTKNISGVIRLCRIVYSDSSLLSMGGRLKRGSTNRRLLSPAFLKGFFPLILQGKKINPTGINAGIIPGKTRKEG